MINEQNKLEAAMALTNYYGLVERKVAKLEGESANLCHMVLGIFTEIEELGDAYRTTDGIDWVNVREEVGDIMFYVVGYSIFRGFRLEVQITHRTYTIENVISITGKIANLVKKNLAYKREIDVEKERELCQKAMNALMNFYDMGQHIDPIQAMERVSAKLEKRYANGFSTEAALNRDHEAERKALEGK